MELENSLNLIARPSIAWKLLKQAHSSRQVGQQIPNDKEGPSETGRKSAKQQHIIQAMVIMVMMLGLQVVHKNLHFSQRIYLSMWRVCSSKHLRPLSFGGYVAVARKDAG